jgi:hypothetical protein
MKNYAIILVVLYVMAAMVCAQGYTSPTLPQTSPTTSIFNPVKYVMELAAMYYVVLPSILVGGVLTIGIIIALQYAGIDVIGWSIEIGKFMFENLFLLIRWTLANEANLISMVVLFLIFWIFILFGLPKMM